MLILIILKRAVLDLTKGMSHASNVQPDSEQLLMSHEEFKSSAVV